MTSDLIISHTISGEKEYNHELIASDNLHPSGLMYEECVKLIYKDVDEIYTE